MKIVLLGRFQENKILGGPYKFANELSNNLSFISKSLNFQILGVEYFFSDLPNTNFITRLFGKETLKRPFPLVRLGLLNIVLFLIKYRPDIIHIVTAERFILILLLLKFLYRGKIITTFHSSVKYELTSSNVRNVSRDLILEKMLLLISYKRIFVSKAMRNLFHNYCKKDHQKDIVIYNGNNYHPALDVYNKWGDNTTYNIVFYSGFDQKRNRGLDYIINVFEILNENRFTLHIIGKKPKMIHPRIKMFFYPLIEPSNFANFFVDKHFIIKSDFFDSFSIFTLEALNYLIIPIVNINTGISEILTDRKNGFIYDTKENLLFLLKNILQNNYDFINIVNEGTKLSKIFSWQKVTSYYYNEYLTVFNNHYK